MSEQIKPVATYEEWFLSQQGHCFDGMWSFAKAAWEHCENLNAETVQQLQRENVQLSELIDRMRDDEKQLRAELAAAKQQLAEVETLRVDAERYQWLRNPDTNVALVLDKYTGHREYDEGTQTGGYSTYEYRAGTELDAAIDAARTTTQAAEK